MMNVLVAGSVEFEGGSLLLMVFIELFSYFISDFNLMMSVLPGKSFNRMSENWS
jgi:hypothetical protein